MAENRRNPMAVTIKDVASRAGVSVKTVSRAMNDHPDVSFQTRELVREIARTLGYRPNPAARGLRTGSTGMIALLAPDLLNPHFAELTRHLQAITRAEGLLAVLSGYDSSELTSATATVLSFIEHRVDGLIWMTDVIPDAAMDALVAAKMPTVVSVGTPPEGAEHIRAVTGGMDPAAYELAAFNATEHLISLGHRRLAYLAESPKVAGVRARIAGFERALSTHDLPPGAGRVWPDIDSVAPTPQFGYLTTRQVLSAAERPTAILASSDMVAMGVLRGVQECGLRIPDDISVVGHDGITHSAFTAPPLTTMQTPYEEWCQTALRLLRYLIDPVRRTEPVCELGFVLVERDSTGPAPGKRKGGDVSSRSTE